jgi:hypothetical protein
MDYYGVRTIDLAHSVTRFFNLHYTLPDEEVKAVSTVNHLQALWERKRGGWLRIKHDVLSYTARSGFLSFVVTPSEFTIKLYKIPYFPQPKGAIPIVHITYYAPTYAQGRTTSTRSVSVYIDKSIDLLSQNLSIVEHLSTIDNPLGFNGFLENLLEETSDAIIRTDWVTRSAARELLYAMRAYRQYRG